MNPDNQKEYWDEVASSKTFTHPLNAEIIKRYLDKESKIVDFGCGYGRTVNQLSGLGYKNVTGYDTSKELINRGRAENNMSIFQLDDPLVIPVDDDSIDCILLFAVITCIPSNKGQAQLLQLLHSKLKPGGIIYLSDYYLQDHSPEVERYTYLNNDKDNYGVFYLPEGVTFRHHTEEWIATLTQQFTILSKETIQVQTMNGHIAKGFQLVAQK